MESINPRTAFTWVPSGARIELGTETIPVVARVLEGDEREQVWSRQKAAMPGFADYEAATTRTIPVICLDRA